LATDLRAKTNRRKKAHDLHGLFPFSGGAGVLNFDDRYRLIRNDFATTSLSESTFG
jgi:hypothetical protein